MSQRGGFNWSMADENECISVESRLARCTLSFGSHVTLYLSTSQAETLHDELCKFLNMSKCRVDAVCPGKNAIEGLIVARDNLLSACDNLGITKECGVSNESN